MRKFCSYGPVNKRLHYYAERKELIKFALLQMRGENPEEGGHYITVWAPRQRGKTWVMQQVLWTLRDEGQFNAVKVNVQVLQGEESVAEVLGYIVRDIGRQLERELPRPETMRDFEEVFARGVLDKPLVLIIDEFDSLSEGIIADMAGAFRNVYVRRQDEEGKATWEKTYLLHGLALVGVRAVLGIGNERGSPFNVQRSLHIPNLTFEEVEHMYRWYEEESGQRVEQEVIERIFYETQGQPGLVSWLGELLTEQYNDDREQPITVKRFEEVYSLALNALPNSNILNIISKARQDKYRDFVLEMFKTGEKIYFSYDDERMNFLYLNGVVDWEQEEEKQYVRFSCPFVQKRLFNYFARSLYREVGRLYDPFEDLSPIITEEQLNVANLLHRYEQYVRENQRWLWRDAPRRRTDFRPYEAVYHFNLYEYLDRFMARHGGQVWPEFPTGNGKVDLLIRYAGKRYAIEVKSFAGTYEYRRALRQAARYGAQLGLEEITLALFVERVDDENRARFEVEYRDEETGVRVQPVFLETG